MKCAQKGFTLIEIMIVVAIIAILAAIAIPNFISYRKTSQMNACKANMKAIVAACEAYTMKNGELTAAPALDDLTNPEKGAFLKSVPKCPIANSGNYTLILTNGIFGVTCPNASADTAYPHEM